MCLKCLEKLQEWVLHTKIRKKGQYMSANTYFSWYSPTKCWPQSFKVSSLEALKTPTVFGSNLKWRHTSPTHFWCPSNHSQPRRDLWNGATVCEQTCPCVHWFRWRMSWSFVVNCDFIKKKNLTVIKLGIKLVCLRKPQRYSSLSTEWNPEDSVIIAGRAMETSIRVTWLIKFGGGGKYHGY
jgi:hypothetical protein